MEELRAEVLAFLAERQSTAHAAETIHRRLRANGQSDCTLPQVQAALTFLESLGFARHQHAPLGATKYWQATAQGVLHHERSL